jgi:hypothetical protein
VISLLYGALAALFADTAWFAFLHAQQVGFLKVLTEGTALFKFKTKIGTFSILPKERQIEYKLQGRAATLYRDELKGLEYKVNETYAFVQELLMGYEFRDVMPRYHDSINWFSIAAVKVDGTRVPLYVSGQYERKEFWLGWYVEAQEWCLARLGLFTDVEAQSNAALEKLQSKLGNLPLV